MNFIVNHIGGSGIPHKHNYHEIIICTEGSGILYCDKYQKSISVGDIIIVPPDATHHILATPNIDRIYMNGEMDRFFSLDSVYVLPYHENDEGFPLAKMIYQNRLGNLGYVHALINAFLHYLLINIKIDNKVHESVKEIADKITNEFSDSDLSVSEILRRSGYAEDYIRAQFKCITGKTPTEFLTNIRISHACHLIDTYKHSIPLTEIAEQCGYTDYVYFSKKFKQITGIMPRKYTEIIISEVPKTENT